MKEYIKESVEASNLTEFDFLDLVEVFVVAKRVEFLAPVVEVVIWLLVGLRGNPESSALAFLFPSSFRVP